MTIHIAAFCRSSFQPVGHANSKRGKTRPAAHAGIVVNLVEWDGGELPAVYERTDQLPFTREDLWQLVQSDFNPTKSHRWFPSADMRAMHLPKG